MKLVGSKLHVVASLVALCCGELVLSGHPIVRGERVILVLFLYIEKFAYGPLLAQYCQAQLNEKLSQDRRRRELERQSPPTSSKLEQTSVTNAEVDRSRDCNAVEATVASSAMPVEHESKHEYSTDAFDLLGGDISDISE